MENKISNRLFFVSFLLLVFMFIGNRTMAQSNDSYAKLMKKYIIVSNSQKTIERMIPQILKPFEENSVNVPQQFWNTLTEEIENDFVNNMAEMLTPIYRKYLTQKDLADIVTFYESSAGKKLSGVAPNLASESLIAGQEWGKSLLPKIKARMKEKGYMKSL
jgi:hypothetical protein